MISTARKVNDFKPVFVADKICEAAAAAGTNQVTCLGLAFKPDIDDLRESPAIEVARLLAQRDMNLTLVEPNISAPPEEFANMKFATLDHALQEQNRVFAVLVAHQEFRDSTALKEISALDFCGAGNR